MPKQLSHLSHYDTTVTIFSIRFVLHLVWVVLVSLPRCRQLFMEIWKSVVILSNLAHPNHATSKTARSWVHYGTTFAWCILICGSWQIMIINKVVTKYQNNHNRLPQIKGYRFTILMAKLSITALNTGTMIHFLWYHLAAFWVIWSHIKAIWMYVICDRGLARGSQCRPKTIECGAIKTRSIFSQNSRKMHPIARPLGRGMGCVLLCPSYCSDVCDVMLYMTAF